MSNTQNEPASLELCNLVSGGMSLSEARKFIVKKENGIVDFSQDEEKKLSAAEKKELLKAEIEALGYEAPADNASVAQFKQALDAAKEDAETNGENENENEDEAKDLL